MNQEEKEPSFFKKVMMSITKLERYPELASKNWKVVISYMVKLLAIFTVVATFCSLYSTIKIINNSINYLNENIPDFTFENNSLATKDGQTATLEDKEGLLKTIIIDTNSIVEENKIDEYKKELKNKETGIILLKDKILIKAQLNNDSITEYSYSTISEKYQIQKFDKQEFFSYLSGKNLVMLYVGMFIITFIYMFIMYFISMWLDVFLLGVFGQVTALFMRLRLKLSAMCKIAIYSLTLPIILNILEIIIETFTEFKLTYFQIMYIGIACIYIVASILMIKSDVIKNKQELAKIIEEQVKVKEELERKKQEEEEKQKEKDRQERKEKKKEKKEDKEGKEENLGDEPQGENA